MTTLFRNVPMQETLDKRRRSSNYNTQGPNYTQTTDATYYDVLKCEKEFATPSGFFSKPLKATHSSSQIYPWGNNASTDISQGIKSSGAKHKLRRTTMGNVSQNISESAGSSSMMNSSIDNSLPPSVFRLPGVVRSDSNEPWLLSGLTSGGRALRGVSQVGLSKFDRKINIS